VKIETILPIMRGYSIGSGSVLLAMSFGLLTPNAIIMGSIFAIQVMILSQWIKQSTISELKDPPKSFLGEISRYLGLFILLLMCFGLIEFWYMLLISYLILFMLIAMKMYDEKDELK